MYILCYRLWYLLISSRISRKSNVLKRYNIPNLRVSSIKTGSRITNYDIRAGYACRKWVARVHPTGSKLILRSGEEYGKCKSSRSSFAPMENAPTSPGRTRTFDSSDVAPHATVASVETMLYLRRISSSRNGARGRLLLSFSRATAMECKLVISWSPVRGRIGR